jgi:hypothetical protein
MALFPFLLTLARSFLVHRVELMAENLLKRSVSAMGRPPRKIQDQDSLPSLIRDISFCNTTEISELEVFLRQNGFEI